MKKRLTLFIASLGVLFGFVGLPLAATAPASAAAVDVFQSCSSNQTSDICKAQGGAGLFGANSIWSKIISIIIYIIGAVSVVMIIIGGLRYALSNGDQGQVTAGKNTIMYAVVGLVVAIGAQALVSFVLSKFL